MRTGLRAAPWCSSLAARTGCCHYEAMADPGTPGALEMSNAFRALEPPPHVLKALHAGQFAILGGLDDEDLQAIGLSPTRVRALLRESEALDSEGMATVRSAWNTSKKGDTSWLRIMEEALDLSEGWRYALAASWALYSPFFDAQFLEYGPVGSRANALLHVAHVDLTVTEIQASCYSLAAEVAEGQVSAFQSSALFASSMVAGGMAGYFTGGAGVPLVARAAEWVGGRLAHADDWVVDLAERWFVTSALIGDDPSRVLKVAEGLYAEAGALSGAAPSAVQGKRVRMLLSAYQDLLAALREEGATGSQPSIPNVVGMRLSDAKAALRAIGVQDIEEVDACSREGEQRFAIMESKWLVRGQKPAAGTPFAEMRGPARLAYSRPDERVFTTVVERRLEDPLT